MNDTEIELTAAGRVAVALAELGYPDARVTENADGVNVRTECAGCPPLSVAWQALLAEGEK